MPVNLAEIAVTPIVADGSWSAALQARGVSERVPAETANVEQPEAVAGLAREYLNAGARILCTNTFLTTETLLNRRNCAHDPLALLQRGAQIARRAAGSEALVAGVLGPSGRILAVQEAGAEELAEEFAGRARRLAEEGVDLILLETFSELEEALVALRAIRGVTDLPVVVSFSFDSGPQRTRTTMGITVEACAAAVGADGAAAFGCNCGGGIATALPAIVAMRAATHLPLWVKPSAGLPELEAGRAVYRTTADEFIGYVPALLDAGADIIGGCCGVGPEHIKRLAGLVESRVRGGRAAVGEA